MPRTSRPITVTLGELQASVDRRVQSGAYSSTSEVLRDAVRALDREEWATTEWLRREVDKALNNPNPPLPAREVLARLEKLHEEAVKQEREKI